MRKEGDGFWSGTVLGASLGLVYAPCAGPILAGVITVSASQPFTAGRLAVALSYGIGSAAVLYVLMLGGRRLSAPLARRGPGLQIAMGAVMVVVALAMLGEYDIRFQNRIASDLPSWLVNPSHGFEDTASAREALADIKGEEAHGVGGRAANGEATSTAGERSSAGAAGKVAAGPPSGLPTYGPAPEFVDNQHWFNTPGDRPLTMSGLRGRVVLIDFWTYSCINCLRTLPYLNAWNHRYRKDGLTIVGVHSPEFPFEKDTGNVEDAIQRNGIEYPVAQDNDLATWSAWGNQYWPAEYFVDAKGRVRFADFGEGKYGEKEHVIRELLAEAGRHVGAGESDAHGIAPSAGVTTPETYLGAARAERFTNPMLSPGTHDFGNSAPAPGADEFAYRGRWRITLESATAEGGASPRPQLRRPPRLHGPRPERRPQRPDGSAPRRPPDLSGGRRQRRPWRQRRGRLAAPLRARRPASGRTPRAHPEAGTGGDGLLLHLRLVRTSSCPEKWGVRSRILGTLGRDDLQRPSPVILPLRPQPGASRRPLALSSRAGGRSPSAGPRRSPRRW